MNIKIIKKQMNHVYKDKNGKEHKSFAYFVKCDNGKVFMIKPVFDNDYPTLDFISEYVK